MGNLEIEVLVIALKPMGKGVVLPSCSFARALPLRLLKGGRKEIDVHGRSVKEALAIVAQAVDHAVVGQLDELVIRHGVGTGALASAIVDWLRENQFVYCFRLAQVYTSRGTQDLGRTKVVFNWSSDWSATD